MLPAISADGRHIVFASLASNLVPGDTNGREDIFVAGPGIGPAVGGLTVDEVALPDGLVPVSRVELGIAPPSASRAEVDFTMQADLVAGRFSGTFDASSLPPGDQRLWARACLGTTCGARWVPVPR